MAEEGIDAQVHDDCVGHQDYPSTGVPGHDFPQTVSNALMPLVHALAAWRTPMWIFGQKLLPQLRSFHLRNVEGLAVELAYTALSEASSRLQGKAQALCNRLGRLDRPAKVTRIDVRRLLFRLARVGGQDQMLGRGLGLFLAEIG